MSTLDFRLVTDAAALVQGRDGILALFRECFDRPLDEAVWEWAYARNPSGPAIVSLCFDGPRLAGHYAVIPIALNRGGRMIRAGLSMTTMVAREYRAYGVFAEQARQVYDAARDAGYELIIGFPNRNSAPGFRKRLCWRLHADYIATLSGERLCRSRAIREYLERGDLIEFAADDPAARAWRLSKPPVPYDDRGRLISKPYESGTDIVFMRKGFEDLLEAGKSYNVLIDGAIAEFRDCGCREYTFGYLPLTGDDCGAFKKDLILSDVF